MSGTLSQRQAMFLLKKFILLFSITHNWRFSTIVDLLLDGGHSDLQPRHCGPGGPGHGANHQGGIHHYAQVSKFVAIGSWIFHKNSRFSYRLGSRSKITL